MPILAPTTRAFRLLSACLLIAHTAGADSLPVERPGVTEAERRDDGCLDVVRERTGATNAAEICPVVLGPGLRAAPGGARFDAVVDLRQQPLGDGATAWVFEHRASNDAYAYQPSFHYELRGGRLELLFDAEGVPARYATELPRVNHRYQIQRVQEAEIPGVYRKRQVEVWFWHQNRYIRAFTRTTIGGAASASLNGTETQWNESAEAAYRSAGISWSHRVKSGDTLSGIASKHSVSTRVLARQNGLGNAHRLKIGQVLSYDSWKEAAR